MTRKIDKLELAILNDVFTAVASYIFNSLLQALSSLLPQALFALTRDQLTSR